MTSTTSLRRAIAAVFLAGAAVAVALPASAHAELVSSDPADGSTVTELNTIHFEFSEDLLDIGNSVVVTDGAGVAHDADLTYPQANQIDAAVTDVAPGDVTIAWRNASVDGHTEEGELHVTLEAPAPSVTPSSAPSSSAGLSVMPVTAPSPSPTAMPVGEGGSGMSPWLWALLGLVVIGGAGAAIVAATRRPPTES